VNGDHVTDLLANSRGVSESAVHAMSVYEAEETDTLPVKQYITRILLQFVIVLEIWA